MPVSGSSSSVSGAASVSARATLARWASPAELMGRAVEQGGDAALASGLGDAPVTLGGRHPLHLKAE